MEQIIGKHIGTHVVHKCPTQSSVISILAMLNEELRADQNKTMGIYTSILIITQSGCFLVFDETIEPTFILVNSKHEEKTPKKTYQ